MNNTKKRDGSDSLHELVVHEWVLINPPRPIDEETYDICLNSKEIIEGVEFWAFGGGFKPLARRVNGKLVAYPLEDVHSFKLHNDKHEHFAR